MHMTPAAELVRPMGMAGNANANDDLHFVSPPGIIFPKRDLLDVGIVQRNPRVDKCLWFF